MSHKFPANGVYSAMRRAIQLAESVKSEVPVAAIMIDRSGVEIEFATNQIESSKIPTEHAEFVVMRATVKRTGFRSLRDFALVTTWEPCDFCTAACELYRVGQVFFGAYNLEKRYTCPQHWIGGIYERESAKLLRDVFQEVRDLR